jgi:hypothetical protein
MLETESRQVRRARERRVAQPPQYNPQRKASNRAERRAQRPDDTAIIMRPTSMNAAASLRRARRDSLIRLKRRPARGMVHPKMISMHRLVAIRITQMIFALAARRAEARRDATTA